jgi:serine/threonine protein kinase
MSTTNHCSRCGADHPEGPCAAQSPADPLVGTTVAGKYVVERFLGRGRDASVYLVRNVLEGSLYSMKRFENARVPEQQAMRFARETAALSRAYHPILQQLVDIAHSDAFPVIVSSSVEGPTLEEVLSARGPLAPQAAAGVIASIAEGLDFIAGLGFVHGAVKPSKILLASDDASSPRVVQVRDIAARRLRSAFAELQFMGVTQTGNLFPSEDAWYMAPEVIYGKPETPRTDVFGLGAVAVDMLVGIRPAPAGAPFEVVMRAAQDRGPEVRALLAPVAPQVSEVVARALAPKPEDRYPSCGEFAAAFSAAVGGAAASREAAPAAAPSPPPVPSAVRAEPPSAESAPRRSLVARVLGRLFGRGR